MENKHWVPCKVASAAYVNPLLILMVLIQDDGSTAYIIGGKPFASDLTFTQVCRNWKDALNGLEASGLDLV